MYKIKKYRKIATPILILISILLLSISSSATILLNINDLENGRLENQTETYQYIADHLVDQIHLSENLLIKLEANENIQAILRDEHENQSTIDAFYYSIDFDNLITGPSEGTLFERLVIYTTNPTVVLNDQFVYLTPSIQSEGWFLRINQARRNLTLYSDANGIYFLYKIAVSDNPNAYVNFGVIPLDLQFLQHLKPSETKILLTNVALNSLTDIYGDKELTSPINDYFGINASSYLDDEMVLVYDILSGTSISKWSLFIISNKLNLMNEFITYAAILFVVFSLLASAVLYRYSFIRKIDRSFAELSLENLESIIANDSPNQIDRIIKSLYSKMESLVRRNRELDVINQQKEEQKNKAEIKALLSQINPHYIFNLLNSIHKRALKNNELESAKMILLMSKQLRRSLEWKEPFVSIQDELEHIQSYIQLQQYYLGMECNFIYMVDEKLFHLKVPKLIFQTLIENALKHGVKTAPFYIKLYESDGNIWFTLKNEVSDKPRDVESKVNQAINASDDSEPKEGIGLRNMMRRLRFYYGERYRILVESDKKHISLTIILPKSV
jgi:two-component system, sensor histidine kinase YesM